MPFEVLAVIENQLDLLASTCLGPHLHDREFCCVLLEGSGITDDDLEFAARISKDIGSFTPPVIDLRRQPYNQELLSALFRDYRKAACLVFRPPGVVLSRALDSHGSVVVLQPAQVGVLLGQALPATVAEAYRGAGAGMSPTPPAEGYILADVTILEGWAEERVVGHLGNLLHDVAQWQDLTLVWSMPLLERPNRPATTPRDRLLILEGTSVTAWVNFLAHARLVITDRTDVAIAACLLQVPCVTLGDRTDAPETVRVGANLLAGANLAELQYCAAVMLRRVGRWIPPFEQRGELITLSAAQ